MKQIYSDVITFRGSHYDFGFKQGQLLKDSLILENRKRQWRIRRPRFRIDPTEAKQAFLSYAPGIWEELIGLQDALEWPMKDVLQEFSGYRLEIVPSGCSIVTGKDYMIRNYDYHPKTYEGRYIIFKPTSNGYATVGPSQRITGRMDGMNEHGLTMGYNFIHRKKPGDGFVCNMIGRIVLETCRTVDEAIQLLKEIPHRHSFSYVVLDSSEITYVVEATPRHVHIREANVCTNHFETLTDENRYHLDDSIRRMKNIIAQKDTVTNASQAFRLMNDSNKGVFSKEYKNWAGTIHTSGYFPKEKKAWFALGGDREPTTIDFDKWTKGEELGITRLVGEVDTDLPFVHMDRNAK